MRLRQHNLFAISATVLAAVGLAGQPTHTAIAAPVAHGVVTIPPCRILDTRQGSGTYNGMLAPGEDLSLHVSGSNIILQGGNPSNCPLIPSPVYGVFVNVIAVETQGAYNNDLGIKPFGSNGGGTAINYNPGTFALNNGLLVGTCAGAQLNGYISNTFVCDQDITLNNGMGASTYVVIDVTGYLQ